MRAVLLVLGIAGTAWGVAPPAKLTQQQTKALQARDPVAGRVQLTKLQFMGCCAIGWRKDA